MPGHWNAVGTIPFGGGENLWNELEDPSRHPESAGLEMPIGMLFSWHTLIDVLADFAFIVIVVFTAVKWVGAGLPVDIAMVLIYALILALVMAPINAWLGLYQRVQHRTIYNTRARAVLSLHLAVPIASVIYGLMPLDGVSRPFLEISAMIGVFGVLTNRVRLSHAKNRPRARDRVLIYGVGERAQTVNEVLGRASEYVEVLGCYPSPVVEPQRVPEDRVLSRTRALTDTVRMLKADELVVAVTDRRGGALPLRELLDCKLQGVRVYDLASYFEQTLGQIRLDALYAGWLIFGDGFSQGLRRVIVKRAFDIVCALILLIPAAPVMLIAAVLIVLESGFPILFRQERVGLNGRLFKVVKFRSMRTDAEKDGPRWATAKDDRVTRVGRFIRKTRIDELPQIFNVLLGQMSMVGPRPERPYFVDQLTRQIPFYAVRHAIKPGLTGWAQVRYHYGASVEDSAEKLQYDLYYVKNHTLMLDLVVLFETVGVVLNAEGAH
jgi:sugar transferase (PEP-CTERM system associated)